MVFYHFYYSNNRSSNLDIIYPYTMVGWQIAWLITKEMKDFVSYWKDVTRDLDNPFPSMPHKLQLSFWPSTTYTMANASMFNTVQVWHKRMILDLLWIACNKLKESYNLYKDVLLGDYVFVHRSNTNIYPMWMGRTLIATQFEINEFHYGQLQICYWIPSKGKNNMSNFKHC